MTKSALVKAINADVTTTDNGMPTYTSSLDACVDFFFHSAASRGKDVTGLFSKAFAEEPNLAIRLSLWLRDVRAGAGERQLFRDVFSYIIKKDTSVAKLIMARIPELGRWDDLFVCFNTALERDALSMINHALRSKDALCAKWMPRKGDNARKIRAYMQVSPRVYRKLVSALSNTVEQKMCAGEWGSINYSQVPSVASARYQKAFGKNDPVGYVTYLADLEKGVDKDGKQVKINAGAVYPYDLFKSVRFGNSKAADAQWDALPDFMGGSTRNVLAVVDVSGSMDCPAGKSNSVSCMDVAVSLGLYVSQRNTGLFQDTFTTFSDRPKLHTLKGSLSDRIKQLPRCDFYGSTNIEANFKMILDAAVKHSVPQSEMPEILLIMSDMQFNQGCDRPSEKSIEMIERMYSEAGYKVPQVVYWNIRSSNGVPVEHDKSGVALISGFSPSIMASVLGADPEEFSPRAVMIKALKNDRYNY
jgi:hypothetical protein